MISTEIERIQASNERIKNNIASAYTKAEEKGATLPEIQNSDNLASTIENIDTGEWKPQSDWWDIKKIVEEDTEDYPAKVIWLIDDFGRELFVNDYSRLNVDKLVTSDGQTITQNGTYVIGENGMKHCSKGYDTFYVIGYLKSTKYDCSYKQLPYFLGVRYMYLYNVDSLGWNSSFNYCGYHNLEAIESNLTLSGGNSNNSMPLGEATNLRKIPKIIWNRTNVVSPSAINLNSVNPNLDMTNYIETIKSPNVNWVSGQMPNINMAFYNEIIDFEDWGIDTTLFIRTNTIKGPYGVKKIDFTNITLQSGSFICRELYEVSNIKFSNSYFNSYYISHDTLVRVLNALYDYSDSTDTYTLTLGNINIAKLTEEELAIGQNKGWTIS